jgi:tripartite-type tricarboxylate transporter receptor subunit TctC
MRRVEPARHPLVPAKAGTQIAKAVRAALDCRLRGNERRHLRPNRVLICVLAVVALTALAAAAAAQDYPNRMIKVLQGFPPGGNVDAVARLLAQEMSKSLGQSIVVEGKPGLAGSLAAEAVARADPDGYTLLVLPSAHAATAALSRSLKYKPLDDFAWISTVSFYPLVLTVRKDSKYRSLSELLNAARADPGKLTYGSAGIGTIPHMIVELLASMAKVKWVHVPYRGEAPSFTGLLSGDVDFVVNTTTVAVPQVREGAVRALAVTSRSRWKDLPDVPTVEESGLSGFEVISWTGIAASAGIPQPIAERLHAEVLRAIKVPDVRTRLESFGAEVRGSTPAEMRALLERHIALWSKVGKEASIQLE